MRKETQKESSNKRHHGWEKRSKTRRSRQIGCGEDFAGEMERSQICCRCREEGEHNSDEEAEYYGFLSRLRGKI